MKHIFELENVFYSYMKSQSALIDINFSVDKGEKITIMGANGCGKSTLLKILDYLIKPDSGKIYAFDKPLNNLKANDEYKFRRKVGFVFQDPDVQLFNTSVFDEIAFALLQMGYNNEEVIKRTNDVINLFGIDKIKDKPPHRLSGGEKKKVALASIMILNPEVLILDEPTNSLDPRSKKWLINTLINLNKSGTTLIIATHDIDVSRILSDKIIIMNENHQIETIGNNDVLENKKLLESANLI